MNNNNNLGNNKWYFNDCFYNNRCTNDVYKKYENSNCCSNFYNRSPQYVFARLLICVRNSTLVGSATDFKLTYAHNERTNEWTNVIILYISCAPQTRYSCERDTPPRGPSRIGVYKYWRARTSHFITRVRPPAFEERRPSDDFHGHITKCVNGKQKTVEHIFTREFGGTNATCTALRILAFNDNCRAADLRGKRNRALYFNGLRTRPLCFCPEYPVYISILHIEI